MKIVVLTGAGISAESGIKTFRDTGGLWENSKIEDVATPEGFTRNPQLVYDFYNARRSQLFDSGLIPNKAHIALAEYGKLPDTHLTLITQNVDNLHERAGSEDVIHMHGELLSAKCALTDKSLPWQRTLNGTDLCNCCSTPQPLRPGIVWFGEMPMYMERIYDALQNADIFCAIGTSGHVYPAAGFVDIAQQHQVNTVLINIDKPDNGVFDEVLLGNASERVPQWISSL